MPGIVGKLCSSLSCIYQRTSEVFAPLTVFPSHLATPVRAPPQVRREIQFSKSLICLPDGNGHSKKHHCVHAPIRPWHAPVRMLGMNPLLQGCGWAGHCSQGWPHARPMVAQHRVLVQMIPLSWPWHIWLLTWVKHGPVL